MVDGSMKSLQKLSVLCVLFFCFVFASAEWKQCTKRKSFATNIRVEVSECDNASERRCPLYIGESHIITIFFTPNTTTNNTVERIILARLNNILSTGKSLEIAYGTALNVTEKITRLSDGNKVSETGLLENGVEYKYIDEFPVPRATTTPLTVRFVLREFIPGKSSRWESHKGILFACVEIDVLVTHRSTTQSST